jgi:hypothetical protein
VLHRLVRFLIASLVGAFWYPLKFMIMASMVGVHSLLYGAVPGGRADLTLVALSIVGALDLLAWGLDRASRAAAHTD